MCWEHWKSEERRGFVCAVDSRYDSADIELVVPTMEEGDDFFECFRDIFYNYSRFSTIQPAFGSSYAVSSVVRFWERSTRPGSKWMRFTSFGGNSIPGEFTLRSMSTTWK